MGRYLRLCVVFALSSSMGVLALCQSQSVYPTFPTPPHTPQEVLLLFAGNTADERILLTLNNNRSQPMTTTIIVYTVSGRATPLADVEMVAGESKLVELSPLLRAAGLGRQELGWIKLGYSGVIMEMGAQLTLYPTEGGTGIDSPRSLSADFKSTERDAAFWIPADGKVRLALTNQSAGSLFVRMHCGTENEEFVVAGRTTEVRKIPARDLNLGGHSLPGAMGCEIVSDGAIDALRPVGMVSGPNYSAPIRFYDPKTATFKNLTAVGLETSAISHVVIHNVSDFPAEIVPVLSEATLSKPHKESLLPRMLGPHESAEINIAPLMNIFRTKGIPRATFTIETAASKGALIGSVTQISSVDRLVEDIPLKTSNPAAFARGSYPLRWDEDYTNLVMVTNTASETLRIGGEITAGGDTYVLTRTNIDPGSTIILDVDKWRREGTLDVNGHALPKDSNYGKIHWIEMSNGKKAGLLGRTSLSSVKNRRKSSFSCGSTCEYNFYRTPIIDPLPWGFFPMGYSQNSSISDYSSMVNGNNYTYPLSYSSGMIYVADTSVIGVGPNTDDIHSATISALAAGSTDMSYDEYGEDYNYVPDQEECVQSDHYVERSGTSGVANVVCTPATRGSTTVCTASGPAGTTYSDWQFNDGTNLVTASSGTTATTWVGTAVTSGAVTVKATKGSLGIITVPGALVVTPRAGWSFTAVSPSRVSSITLCAAPAGGPPVNPPDPPVASTKIGASCFHATTGTYSIGAGSGPNNGFGYLASEPGDLSSYTWTMSASADNPSSAFYLAQTGNYNAASNPTGYISGSTLDADTQRHEAGSVNSHYVNYASAVPSPLGNIGLQLEETFVFGGASLSTAINNVLSQVQSYLYNASNVEPCGHQEVYYSSACSFDGYINFNY